jgi:hypothetical protein
LGSGGRNFGTVFIAVIHLRKNKNQDFIKQEYELDQLDMRRGEVHKDNCQFPKLKHWENGCGILQDTGEVN